MGVVFDPQELETKTIHALVDFRDKAVLEIGAGEGRMTWRFAEHAAGVLAIDPVARFVRRARAAMPRKLRSTVRFVVADATAYRYPRGAFDVAVLSHSL